jgi:N-acetylmuramoyl-L-alanine amidase
VAVLAVAVAVGTLVPVALPAGAGRAVAHDPPRPLSVALVVGAATNLRDGGYWLAAANGGVFDFGSAPFEGSAGNLALAQPVLGLTPTVDDRGYWLVARDGGVFSYGDAAFHGSTGGLTLNAPVVGMAPDPRTGGYWLVAADGGVFAFGAPFLGSMGGQPLNQPVVGMAAMPDGRGYWLVAADGGIFAFGDAPFEGSTGGMALRRPITAMAASPSGRGYWLLGRDGGVFAFGVPFDGSAAQYTLSRPAVALAPTAGAKGYYVVAQDGGVFTFGSAPFLGSVYVPPLTGETVAIDPGHDGGNGDDPGYIDQPIDGGGFTESCDTVGAETDAGYPEHAFNFDVATRLQGLLQSQGATVVMTRTTDTGVGPCVNQRAAIGNASGAEAAVSIHADGGPPDGVGYDVIEPAPVVSSISNNTAIVGPSSVLAVDVRNAFGNDTGEPTSDYSGQDGIDQRGDLGGLNLSTVPKILIECANMRNGNDAGRVTDPTWRQAAAQGLDDGLLAYLTPQEQP